MKKLMTILAAFAMVFALTACTNVEAGDDQVTPEPEDKVFETVEARVLQVEDERVLVDTELGKIWFGYSDTTELEMHDVIEVTYESGLMESDPMQGTMESYEMIEEYVAPVKFDLTASEILRSLVNDSGAEFGGSIEDVITADNQQWFLGAGEYPEFKDSAVYTPMMNVDVSLIVVLKVEMEEVETLKETIMESIDPARLVCVTFDLDEDVVVDSYGDTVVLIINKMYKQEIHDAFIALQ